MAQLTAIVFLAVWVGFVVYIYKTDYLYEEYWARTKFGLWLSIVFSAFIYTLCSSVAAFIVFVIGAIATGYIY